PFSGRLPGPGRWGRARTLPPSAPAAGRPPPPFFTPDPAAWVGNVRPFVVPDAALLRTKGPNRLTSHQYAKDFNEVKLVGSRDSTVRTKDQTEAAIWWQMSGAFWNAVTRSIVAERPELDVADNARLFAMENLEAAAGFIGSY